MQALLETVTVLELDWQRPESGASWTSYCTGISALVHARGLGNYTPKRMGLLWRALKVSEMKIKNKYMCSAFRPSLVGRAWVFPQAPVVI